MLRVLALLMAILPAGLNAKTYKCTDEQGGVTFQQRPCDADITTKVIKPVERPKEKVEAEPDLPADMMRDDAPTSDSTEEDEPASAASTTPAEKERTPTNAPGVFDLNNNLQSYEMMELFSLVDKQGAFLVMIFGLSIVVSGISFCVFCYKLFQTHTLYAIALMIVTFFFYIVGPINIATDINQLFVLGSLALVPLIFFYMREHFFVYALYIIGNFVQLAILYFAVEQTRPLVLHMLGM